MTEPALSVNFKPGAALASKRCVVPSIVSPGKEHLSAGGQHPVIGTPVPDIDAPASQLVNRENPETLEKLHDDIATDSFSSKIQKFFPVHAHVPVFDFYDLASVGFESPDEFLFETFVAFETGNVVFHERALEIKANLSHPAGKFFPATVAFAHCASRR